MRIANTTPYNSGNVFAKILRGEIPCYKIFETKDAISILDAFPTTRGHSLLIPKHPNVNFLDMSSSVAANVLKEIPRLSRALQKATNADGITVLSNSGSAAGQVVFHSHIHIVPRYEGDGLGEFVQIRSKASIQPEEANEILTSIQSHLENE